jgi:F-type H+-transporting ATPase subunit b
MKAGPAFRARTNAIQAAIAEGTRAREEGEQRRLEAEKKLAGIQQEIAAMREQAKRDDAAESQRIRDLARDEAAKMDRAAELEIAAAERAARLELKATAARLAVERAEADLRQQLTPPADAQLVRNFAGNLAGSSN